MVEENRNNENDYTEITRHKGPVTSPDLLSYFSDESIVDPFVITPARFKKETGLEIPDEIITVDDEIVAAIYNDERIKLSYRDN